MQKFVAVLVLLNLSACAVTAERPRTVKQVIENHEDLNGKLVTVSGWLGECQRLSCPLYDSREEAQKANPYFLSIGGDYWFDFLTRGKSPSQITLRGRVNSRCIDEITLCTDRSDDLVPVQIIEWDHPSN